MFLLFFLISFIDASFDRNTLIKEYGLPTQVTVNDVGVLQKHLSKQMSCELPSESSGRIVILFNNAFNNITINTSSKSKKKKRKVSDAESDSKKFEQSKKENQAFYLAVGAAAAGVSALACFGYDWWRQSKQKVLFWDGIDENNYCKVQTDFSWNDAWSSISCTEYEKSGEIRNNALLGGYYNQGDVYYYYGKSAGIRSYFFDDYGLYMRSSNGNIMKSDNIPFAVTKLVASTTHFYFISKAGRFYKKKKSEGWCTFLIERLSIDSGNWLESSIVDMYSLNDKIYILTSNGYCIIANSDCSELYGKQHQIFGADASEYRFCKDSNDIKLYHTKTLNIIESIKLKEDEKINFRFSTPSSIDYAFERALGWFLYIWHRKLRSAGIICFGLSLYCCMRYWKLKRAC